MSSKTYLVLAAVVTMTAAGAASGPAQAQSIGRQARVTIQVRVPVGDLDLTQEAGAEALLKRVRLAAARACRSASDNSAVTNAARAERRCRDQALVRAMAQVDSPVVQARYAASHPPRPVTVADQQQ